VIAPTWPTPQELRPALEKLEAGPGAVILIAVESAEARCNFCRVTLGVAIPRGATSFEDRPRGKHVVSW
jgi:hypothetical protein